MNKIDTVEALGAIRNVQQEILKIRDDHSVYKTNKKHIMICGGTGCLSSESQELIDTMNALLEKKDLTDRISVIKTGCFGFCGQGPIMKVYPDNIFYVKVTQADAERIINEHFLNGKIIEDLLFKDPKTGKSVPKYSDMNFYKKQDRVVLKNCGVINPEEIKEYIAFGGYSALCKSLLSMTKESVIAEIKNSGLRGRGGGGFPTGLKWELTAKNESNQKYVICNADEGDPGAFMDRSILEGDPHVVIEAMIIAGYVTGSNKGYIYIRAEYPIAVERLLLAIAQCKEYGFLGNNIFKTDFSFDLEIFLGAGAFVCGEETALIASIEGERGMPKNKPPFPAQSGLWGKPTLINNVETYANIPQIILNGGAWFREKGTDGSPGTKVFALGGNINTAGLVEVPMGITIRDVIFEIGGGIPDGKRFKAVQTGGPSGGCIPEEYLDSPIDFDVLAELGSIIGSGGMIIMNDETCMVDVARFFLDFMVDESCGKCTPCREGTKRMLEILETITAGKGTLDDIKMLENLSGTIQSASLCALGQTASNSVLSTLKYFRHEYDAHVNEDKKTCPAGTCKALFEYFITDKCIGCTKCVRNCPVFCIEGKVKERHVIRTKDCIKCGSCVAVCSVQAIVKQ